MCWHMLYNNTSTLWHSPLLLPLTDGVIIFFNFCLKNHAQKIEKQYHPLGQWGLQWTVPQGTCIIIQRVSGCIHSVDIDNALYFNLKQVMYHHHRQEDIPLHHNSM